MWAFHIRKHTDIYKEHDLKWTCTMVKLRKKEKKNIHGMGNSACVNVPRGLVKFSRRFAQGLRGIP